MSAVLITIFLFSILLGIPALASSAEEEERKAAAKEKQLSADEQIKKLTDHIAKQNRDITDRINETITALNSRVEVEKTLGDMRMDRLAQGQELLTQQEEELAKARERFRVRSQQTQRLKDQVKEAERQLAVNKELTEAQKTQLNETVKAGNEALETAKKNEDAAARYAGKLEKAAEATEAIHKGTASAVTRLTGLAASFDETMLGSIQRNIQNVGGLTAAIGEVGEQFAKQMSPANMFASTIDKVYESTVAMVFQADRAFTSFRRATGGGSEFNAVMMEARVDASAMGASLQQVGEATTVLFTEMRRFSNLTQDTQTELVAFTATMENMGISAAATSQFMNQATTSLGMTTDQAMAAQRELASAAIDLGMAPQEMADGFAAAAPVIAAHGDASIQVMKGLAAAAKATGAEVGELLGVFGQAMNTFDGAAEAAGRLNAILGDDLLNSVDLLNASEDERIRMTIEAIELSGRSFEAMGRFERQALANAAGISDMTTANQIFGQSLSAYDAQQRAARESGYSQEELEERAAGATDAMTKLNAIFESFAIMVRPILFVMHGFLDLILKINSGLGGFLVPTIFTLIGAYALMQGIVKITIALKRMQLFWTALLATKNIFLATTIATETAATQLNTAITNNNFLAKGRLVGVTNLLNTTMGRLMLTMGKILLVAGLVYLTFNLFQEFGTVGKIILGLAAAFFIYGIAQKLAMSRTQLMVTALLGLGAAILAPMHSPPLYVGIFILALGVLALGAAANAVATGLLVLGVSVLMIGAGAALMGAGVMMAAAGLALLFSQIKDMDPMALFTLAAGLVAFSLAALSMGIIFALPFTTLGLVAVAGGLMLISAAMSTLTGEKLSVFNALIDKISNLKDMGGVEISLTAVASGVAELADQIDNIPVAKSIVLAHTVDKLSDFATTVTPASVETAKQMTGVIKEIAEVKIGVTSAILFDKAVDNLVKVLNAATGTGGAAAGEAAAPQQRTVVLELDRRQLGRAVVDLVEERYSLRTG